MFRIFSNLINMFYFNYIFKKLNIILYKKLNKNYQVTYFHVKLHFQTSFKN